MSDGDNATPGPPRLPGPPDAGGDNQWLTRSSASNARRRAVGAQRHLRIRVRREVQADRQQPHRRCDGCRPDREAARRFECSRWTEAHHAANPMPRRHRQGPTHRGHRASLADRGRGPRQRGHRRDPHRRDAVLGPTRPRSSAPGRPGAAVARRDREGTEGTRATQTPHDDGRRSRSRRPHCRAGAGHDRCGVAMAVVEEQHAQHGLRAGPEFTRHPRSERTVR